MKAKRRSNTGFIILVTLILFIIFGSFYSIKAISKEKSYFSTLTDEAESKYLKEVKEVLNCHEVYKAGVTMTKTTLDGKEIDYSVLIHASEYIYDHVSDWDGLMEDLDGLKLEVDKASVTFSFD